MKIESYSFGRMSVDGMDFTKDVIILSERVISPWWRKEGHYLQLEDLEEVVDYRPDILIIGTGYFGVMRVAPEVEERLRDLGIEYHIARSSRAVKLFNSIDSKRKVGAFHLTC